jgi:hypothetical protein
LAVILYTLPSFGLDVAFGPINAKYVLCGVTPIVHWFVVQPGDPEIVRILPEALAMLPVNSGGLVNGTPR